MSKPSSAQIDFAKRYLTRDSTFTAASAIQRLEDLLQEICDVAKLLQPELAKRYAPSFFEFSSYYIVGFVTCLEWHAKSRLYDMFCFNPKTIGTEDLRQAVSNDKLINMISEGLNIPHLLAGSISISTKESYISALNRVYLAVGGQKADISSILKVTQNGTSIGEVLDNLYTSRNNLVHEIGLQTIGHRNIRDSTTFDEAFELGHRLLSMIKNFENALTKTAPIEFPNKLDDDGLCIDEVENLVALIKSLEEKIETEVASNADGIISLIDWQSETANSRKNLSEELKFIDRMNFPGRHYYDTRPFIKGILLKQRLKYLRLLSEELL